MEEDMNKDNKFFVMCPVCNGDGFEIGYDAGHGCDGTNEDCTRTCPVQIQIQVGCRNCGGSGITEEDLTNPLQANQE